MIGGFSGSSQYVSPSWIFRRSSVVSNHACSKAVGREASWDTAN